MTIKNLGKSLFQLETYPFFDIAHNLLAAVEVRKEIDANGQESFPQTRPFVSWLLTIAFIYSGSLTANILLGEPVIAPLANTKQLMVATMMWYFVFFTPFDFGLKTGTTFPVKFVASSINEIYRVRKISNGILQASKFFPNSWLIMLAIATIRGNGSGLMKIIIQLMKRPQQITKDTGFMQLSFPTKISMIAAFLLILERKTGWLGSFELLYLGITFFFIGVKIYALLGFSSFKYLPLENYLCNKIFRNKMGDRSELPKPDQNKKLKDLIKEN